MDDMLNKDQKLMALIYFKNHMRHVSDMVFKANNEYPPELNEDKNDPRLWRPAHWKWFLRHLKDQS